MKAITNTFLVTGELNLYLKENRYFDKKKEDVTNDEILTLWVTKFRLALTEDIQLAFKNIKVSFLLSEFQLASEDERGACLFFHKIILSDTENLEFIKANIKTLITYNQTTLYLDSTYANTIKWEGKSKMLNTIFDRLKTSDKQFAYFSPINLQDFIK